MKLRVLAASLMLGVVLAAGCANAPMATMPAANEVTLMQPLPGLFTAGQPAAKDWAAIRADGIRTEAGDVHEIEVPAFGLPLKSPHAIAPAETGAVAAQAL